jgi:hypothetical protein
MQLAPLTHDASQRQCKRHILSSWYQLKLPPAALPFSLRAASTFRFEARRVSAPYDDAGITSGGSAKATQTGGCLRVGLGQLRKAEEGEHGYTASMAACELLRASEKKAE